jgi:hypothetical protein
MGLIDKNTTPADYYSDNNNYGKYQFTSLDDIINYFQIAYVGEDKIISKISKMDIAFHAQRAMQELSFDTFKSFKAQEIEIPSTLQMVLPQDYVNYVKLSWSDASGIEHTIYPASKTSNPTAIVQTDTGEVQADLITNGNFDEGENNWASQTNSNSTLQQSLGGALEKAWEVKNGKMCGQAGKYKKFYQSTAISIEDGKTYELTYTISRNENDDPITGRVLAALISTTTESTTNTYFKVGTYRKQPGTYTEKITVDQLSTAGNTPWARNFAISNGNLFFQNGHTQENFNGCIDNIRLYDTGLTTQVESDTWANYKSNTSSENKNEDYEDDVYWPRDGERYGLDPAHAQVNGSFYIDENSGKIHFSSNISGKTVILKYISDGLGTDEEMQVHKFAEEAMYKTMLCSIMSGRVNVGRNQLAYYKKEKFAAVRTAKLRLSNIKLEELTQILRGKSKHIKH